MAINYGPIIIHLQPVLPMSYVLNGSELVEEIPRMTASSIDEAGHEGGYVNN